MSISCDAFIGYTVTLKSSLNDEEYDFFDEFLMKYSEYDSYDCKGKVLLVIDGMSGEYARFVFVDEHIEDCWSNDKDYYSLRKSPVPDDVYNALNKAYVAMYGKTLNTDTIEYALWFHYS